MYDKTLSVSLFPVLTGVAWAITVVLLGYGMTSNEMEFCLAGLAMSALAATLNIRCFCGRLSQNITSAFELGREAGRAEVREFVRR